VSTHKRSRNPLRHVFKVYICVMGSMPASHVLLHDGARVQFMSPRPAQPSGHTGYPPGVPSARTPVRYISLDLWEVLELFSVWGLMRDRLKKHSGQH